MTKSLVLTKEQLLVKESLGYTLTQDKALDCLQRWADSTGCAVVKVLPVERTSAIVLLGGNKVANEHEHWLAEIICLPTKWNADRGFWQLRVRNTEEVNTAYKNGMTVFSEFTGHDLCILSHKRQILEVEKEDGSLNVYETNNQWCEPLVDIPLSVGDTIVCYPSVLKKYSKEAHNDTNITPKMPIDINLTEIVGVMRGNTFEPLLHIVVKKVVKEYGFGLEMTDNHKSYQQYLRYVRGATFLPLKPNDLIVTMGCKEYANHNTPSRLRFMHNGILHEYHVVREDNSILAYLRGDTLITTGNVTAMKRVQVKEVMEYLHGVTTSLIYDKEDKRYFKIDGIEGYVLYAAFYESELPIGKYSFGLMHHCIGRVVVENGEIALSMPSDKIAFHIDLSQKYADFAVPQNVLELYDNGVNFHDLSQVVEMGTGKKYIFQSPSFGFISTGWKVAGKDSFNFWYAKRTDILLEITNNMIKPFGSKIVIELVKPESVTETGIIIPDTVTRLSNIGLVVAAGDVLQVNVGDKILFNPHTATVVGIEGKDYLVMKEEDILGWL